MADYAEKARENPEESDSSAEAGSAGGPADHSADVPAGGPAEGSQAGGPTEGLDPVDRRLLTEAQRGIPLVEEPFAGLSAIVGGRTPEVLVRLESLRRRGLIRRFGGIFDTRAMGFASTLVAAAVPPDQLERVASVVSRFPGVTHNYAREDEAYNLWFTVGSATAEGLEEILGEIIQRAGLRRWLRLPTEKVYKIGVKLDLTGEGSGHEETAETSAGPLGTATGEAPDFVDRRLIAVMQGDIPILERPFAAIGRELGLTESEVIRRLRRFQEVGWLRRVAAILRHREAGFVANAMSVWRVPADRVDEAGRAMAAFPEVSHCYRRPTAPDWPYSLYAMIHGRLPDDCRRVADEIARVVRPEAYKLLFSTREFKKTSMTYF